MSWLDVFISRVWWGNPWLKTVRRFGDPCARVARRRGNPASGRCPSTASAKFSRRRGDEPRRLRSRVRSRVVAAPASTSQRLGVWTPRGAQVFPPGRGTGNRWHLTAGTTPLSLWTCCSPAHTHTHTLSLPPSLLSRFKHSMNIQPLLCQNSEAITTENKRLHHGKVFMWIRKILTLISPAVYYKEDASYDSKASI